MVDFRPLLFINALALMLLVTAAFASVREELAGTSQTEPGLDQAVAAATSTTDSVFLEDERAPAETTRDTAVKTTDVPELADQAQSKGQVNREVRVEPFTIDPEKTQLHARAEPVEAMQTSMTASDVAPAVPEPELKTLAEPSKIEKPAPPAPKTGLLVLRSNVIGDRVTVNGRDYGSTRLDLELKPGTYDIVIRKDDHESWQQTVTLEAGDETTLVGKLTPTKVDYRDGRWIGGVKTGDGTLVNSEGLRYEGHFVNGKFHGEGVAWYPDGSRYEGDWKNGQRHGEGTWRGPDDTRYNGQFREDRFSGQGTLTMTNGDILTGQWANGKLNGHGSLTTADGMLYVGGFRNDEFHGEGTLTFPDGRHYEGGFANGEFHGKGKEIFANGKRYQGQYVEGSFHGEGLLSNPNGSSIQATFRYGEPYGQVRLTTAAGEIFTARTTEPGVCYRDKSYRATQCPTLEGW